jgi:hypothetical protein
MKICVLQADYSHSSVDYKNYDPPRDLAALAGDWQVDHLFLNKVSGYAQLKEAARQGYDIFVNLCEAYPEWDVPSVDVIWWLEALDLPFTGPPSFFFNPPKEVMNHVAVEAGVACPACVEADSEADCAAALRDLRFPMFVKPACSGDSLGIDEDSYVVTEAGLRAKTRAVVDEFGRAIIEEYIAGRECTVLVGANPRNAYEPVVLTPFEFRFPPGASFKTYKLKVQEHHPEANVPVDDLELAERLRRAARDVFVNFDGQGYARLDFRVTAEREVVLIDVNFTCGIFYPPGSEGSADYILRADPMGPGGFLRHIVEEGLARHRRGRRRWRRHAFKPSITAVEDIASGSVVICGEERPHRLVTRAHVEARWPRAAVEEFRRNARPLGNGVYVLWAEDPAGWAPQMHSCDPNTEWRGLELVARRDIERGEQLTVDYATCRDDAMAAFECNCGAVNCRGRIAGEVRT